MVGFFLSVEEQRRVVEAIGAAEARSTGEIRVHVESRCPGEALDRAREVFFESGMAATARRNGVLIYIALADRRFAIFGDEGLHVLLQGPFWEPIRDAMSERFRRGEFCEGLVEAIGRVGDRLAEYFPPEGGDVDELRNELSSPAD